MHNKNEVFVINQPTNNIFSVIIVGDEFPLDEKVHDSIFNLNKFSDVALVFSDKLFPKSKSINKQKLANLYNACCWIDSNDSLTESLIKLLNYSKEVFNKHICYLFMNSNDIKLDPVDSKLESCVKKVTASNVEIPMFIAKRLNNEELFDIYKTSDEEICEENKEKSLLNSFLGYFNLNKNTSADNDISNMYANYTSSSNILLLKKSAVEKLLTNFSPEYYKSFCSDDIRPFIASSIMKLYEKIHNCNVKSINSTEEEE